MVHLSSPDPHSPTRGTSIYVLISVGILNCSLQDHFFGGVGRRAHKNISVFIKRARPGEIHYINIRPPIYSLRKQTVTVVLPLSLRSLTETEAF